MQEIEDDEPEGRRNPWCFRLGNRHRQYNELNDKEDFEYVNKDTKVEIVRAIAKAINSKDDEYKQWGYDLSDRIES